MPNYYSSKQHGLNLLFVNINSVKQNLNTLLGLIQSTNCKYDLIGLVETKLSNEADTLYAIKNYSFLSVNRNSHGGGVRLYYRKNLTLSKINHLSGLFNDSHASRSNHHPADLWN